MLVALGEEHAERDEPRSLIASVLACLRRTRTDFSDLRTGEGLPLPARLRAELERECARLDLGETQLRATEAERDTADAQDPSIEHKRNMLIQSRGLGPASAAILTREIPSFRQPTAIGLLARPDAEGLRQRVNDSLPGYLESRQYLRATRYD